MKYTAQSAKYASAFGPHTYRLSFFAVILRWLYNLR